MYKKGYLQKQSIKKIYPNILKKNTNFKRDSNDYISSDIYKLVKEDDYSQQLYDKRYTVDFVSKDETKFALKKENVTIKDNKLVITATKRECEGKEWVSGMFGYYNLITNGVIETKIKLPTTPGMTLYICGETGIYPYKWGETYLLAYSTGGRGRFGSIYYNDKKEDGYFGDKWFDITLNDGNYHILGMAWGNEIIRFYIDDVIMGVLDLKTAETAHGNGLKEAMEFYFELAINDLVNAETFTEEKVYIDWFRIYQSKNQRIE